MNAPKPVSPRARMQELLAIPDSQRSDDEWDELNELEIMFAPGNRIGTPDRSGAGGGEQRNGGGQQRRKGGGGQRPQGAAGGNAPQAGGNPQGGNPQGGDPGAGGKKPARKFRKKPPRNKDKAPAA